MSKPNQKSATDRSGPKIANRKRAGQRKEMDRPVFQPHAAGIDIGAREIFVAVPPERDPDPVRKCETFTGDLHQMAEWLVSCGIATAAMESTGVYFALSSALIGRVQVPPALR
jgi:hypothetical protein